MRKIKFIVQELNNVEVLTRQQLKNTLGGQSCTCTYRDGTQVDNTCESNETIAECCGPAATQKSCGII